MQSSDLLKGAVALIQGETLDGETDEIGVIRLLKRNGFPLLALKKPPSSELFNHAIEEERRKLEIQREEYQRVQEKFLRLGIRPILFKGGGILPSFPYTSGNLDVLIKEGETEEARGILEDLGYVELKNIEEPKKFLFRRFVSGETSLAFHLHSQIGWGVPFLSIEGEEGREAPDDPHLLLPFPETGCLVTLSHSLYENKKVRLLDLLQVHHWAKGKLNWERMLERARQRGWEDGFIFSLSLFSFLEKTILKERNIPASLLGRKERTWKEVEMPFPISFLYSKFLYYKKIWMDGDRGLKTKPRDIFATLLWGIELKLKIRSQPPMLVAFSGVDGSGKTAHSKELLKTFKTCGIRTQYVWSRYGSSLSTGLLIKMGKFLYNIFYRKDQTSKNRTEMRKIYLNKSWTRSLWLSTVFLELTLKYFIQVRLPLLFGKVVICDRYLLDAFVELGVTTDHPKIDQSLFGILLRKVNPRPSIGFLLDVSPKTARARKKEAELEDTLHSQTNLYREMGNRLGYTPVNGEKLFAPLSEEINHKTLSSYYNEFWTVIKGLLLANPSQLNPKNEKREEFKVLVFTNMYPYKGDSTCGIFVKEQVDSLRKNGMKIDVLFINGLKNKMNYFWGTLKFLKRIHQNHYTLIHAHHTYCALIGKLQKRIPVLLTFHEGEIENEMGILERVRKYGFWKIPLFSKGLKRWIGRRVDGVISVFPEGGPLLGREDAFTIPCGVDLHLFKPLPQKVARRKLDLPLGDKILLFSADPSRREKRYDIAKEAFQIANKENPDLRLIPLVGISRSQIPLYMNSADLLILTSDFEASPMVIKEAMAVNLPIISFDVGDVAEVIQNIEGCFISPRRAEELALKIQEVLRNGFQRTRGRERVQHLDNEKIAQKIHRVYETVVTQ
ncbi:glycosyltransferase [candidate division TA06 bacterium]|nr:glycosyltransferase [candidate division TA06 bacterium]